MYVLAFNGVFCTHTDVPLISISHAETHISVGGRIVCHADSSPFPNITWSTGGKVVTVCRESKSCPVVVDNDSAGQHVNYTCSARNSVGSDVVNITLTVKGTLHVNTFKHVLLYTVITSI